MTGRKNQRKVYLENIALDEAMQRFFNALEEARSLRPMPGERIPLERAVRRVTAEPIWAKISSPHYHAAAMDGVAVRAEETCGALETSPLRLRLGDQAQWVDTGDPVPPQFNAVIMVEHIHQVDEGHIEIMSAVAPWQHVRLMGEDIVAAELLLPENHVLRPVDLGAVAAAGIDSIVVRCQPKMAIMPTGTELIQVGQPLKPGDIIEFNSLMLSELAREWGSIPTRLSPEPDDYRRLKASVQKAVADHDVVVINAGSSAGREDYTASIIAELGEVLVHGIAIRPGHPVVLGIVKGKPVVGIPGYPVSALLTFELIVKPLIEKLLGTISAGRPTVEAVMSRKVLSPMGEDEFLRVKAGKVGDKIVATPLQRGAGVIMSLVQADGIVRIPRFSEGCDAGQKVIVELLRRPEEIDNTIVAIGSHDMTLDILANQLHSQYPYASLSSSNMGSLGGLMALKQGEAHLAGSHLLDEETGEYNMSFVRRMLPDIEIVIINLVYREQGLIVMKGNPKAIFDLKDLVRPEVSFVNRQRGAGTRVLLDCKLRGLDIDEQQINGYSRVEFTHLAVAAAVASGTADVGVGIRAAAKALDLDYIPLDKERYDLIIPKSHYESPLMELLLSILHQSSFQREVQGLGGYDVSHMGQIIATLGCDGNS